MGVEKIYLKLGREKKHFRGGKFVRRRGTAVSSN